MEDELEQIRRKKAVSAAQRQEQAEMVKKALLQMLEPKAYERLMIVSSQNQKLYSKAAQWIVAAAQQGMLRKKVSEGDMVAILRKLSGERHEPTIEFRRKGE